MSSLTHLVQQLFRFLFLPKLSEHKAVGALVIGLACVLPPTIYGIVLNDSYSMGLSSRLVTASSILGIAAYVTYRLVVIHRSVSHEEMVRQKTTDRFVAMFIIGGAATMVFQSFVDAANGAPVLHFNSITSIITVFAGMRAFTGVMLLSLYVQPGVRPIQGQHSDRRTHNHSSAWLSSLLDSTYVNDQISRLDFWLTVILAFVCAISAIWFYDMIAQQVVIAYTIFEAIFSLRKQPLQI